TANHAVRFTESPLPGFGARCGRGRGRCPFFVRNHQRAEAGPAFQSKSVARSWANLTPVSAVAAGAVVRWLRNHAGPLYARDARRSDRPLLAPLRTAVDRLPAAWLGPGVRGVVAPLYVQPPGGAAGAGAGAPGRQPQLQRGPGVRGVGQRTAAELRPGPRVRAPAAVPARLHLRRLRR